MSSYIGKSFSKQTQDASSCRMHTFGNYGAHSEFHESNYAYEGLALGGSFSSQIPSNSLNREAINTTDGARSSAAVQRTESCSALGSRSFVSTHEYNPLSHGLLSQKAEGNMEVMEKPSGKSRTDDIKMETTSAIKQQTNSTQRQNQSQPQIYPWMTKLHMSHGKVTFKVCFRREENCTHLIPVIASPSYPVLSLHIFLLSFIGQTQEIIKLAAVNFMTKASIARKPVLLLWRGDLRSNLWINNWLRKAKKILTCKFTYYFLL